MLEDCTGELKRSPLQS